jgi:hypothetical protein
MVLSSVFVLLVALSLSVSAVACRNQHRCGLSSATDKPGNGQARVLSSSAASSEMRDERPSRGASGCPEGLRWMTSNPVVPLAVVHARDGIVAVRACCETWGRSGEQWVAVDGWGRNLGVVHVAGATINTATGCHELRWKKGDAAQQGKLFFAGSDYIAYSGVKRSPIPIQRDHLFRLNEIADSGQ